jgi:hypothetical protein
MGAPFRQTSACETGSAAIAAASSAPRPAGRLELRRLVYSGPTILVLGDERPGLPFLCWIDRRHLRVRAQMAKVQSRGKFESIVLSDDAKDERPR